MQVQQQQQQQPQQQSQGLGEQVSMAMYNLPPNLLHNGQNMPHDVYWGAAPPRPPPSF